MKKLRIKPSKRQTARAFYSSQSQLRHPTQMLQLLRRDILASRELAWQLLIRDIKAQYRQSLLGFAWAFIPPVITAVGFMFAKGNGIVNIGETDIPYPAYVMFSTSLWQTFSEAISLPVQQVTNAKMMLAKINFPREALVLSAVGQVFFNFLIKLIFIIGLFIWFRMPVTWSIVLAPVALLHLIMLGTTIGTVLAPIGALYKDVTKGLTFILSFWMLLTPVVYPPPQGGKLSLLINLNPVSPLLVTTRELSTVGILSNPQGFWMASGVAFLGLLLAWMFYRLAMPYVIERMSS
ncbi:ABC-type polysaccharide/polyol phosphate export permease [Halomicronema hongdechloris C2206]|uniref:ABC-type polysaccharide/polyol phosphate export permease n=1 Tax=Halomicronema hongdechloris C2206 TaxID=1641165 RepID=A0A1Z3HMM1_9CYAN|nr:ABC transporter permease [Halomicronema hongdechloris]ASC71563.1 ABC-type polysaccharide/polyol phosphate export permease [Halomicronema hongdechloris C2206]